MKCPGYTSTSFQIYYWYMYNNMVKTYKKVQFDEVINDLEIPNPNFRQLKIALGRTVLEDQ